MDIKISLAAARVNAGMTQKDVAKRLNVTAQTVRAWETGKTAPKSAVLLALSQIYAIPAEAFSVPAK